MVITGGKTKNHAPSDTLKNISNKVIKVEELKTPKFFSQITV
jgi:hypothetical protein